MTAYWASLFLSLLGALWLIPGARLHVYALTAWALASLGMDLIQFYEFKLFLDFFGAGVVTVLTLRDVVGGQYWIGKKVCAYLSLASTAISAAGYGLAQFLYAIGIPLKVFPVLMDVHGWLLCAAFLLAVWSLAWGADVKSRFHASLDRLAGLLGGNSAVHAPQKASCWPANRRLDQA